eukprot:COSAG02_NODE_3496_length_6655_cov_3.090909_1_plen_1304_part_00
MRTALHCTALHCCLAGSTALCGMEVEAEAVFRSLRGVPAGDEVAAPITLPKLATRLSDFGVAEEIIQHILLRTQVQPDGSVQLDAFVDAVKKFRKESHGLPSPRPDHDAGASMLFGLPKGATIPLSPRPEDTGGVAPRLQPRPPAHLVVMDDDFDGTAGSMGMQEVVALRLQLATVQSALWKQQQRAAAAIEHVHAESKAVVGAAERPGKAHPMRLHVLRHHIASLYDAKIKENAADDQHGRQRVVLTEYLREHLVHVYGLHTIARTHERELIAGLQKHQAADRRTYVFARLACSDSSSTVQAAGNHAAESVLELLKLLLGTEVENRMSSDYVANSNASWQSNKGRGVGCQQALVAMKQAQPGAAAHKQRRKQAAEAAAATVAAAAATNQAGPPPSDKELQMRAELAEMRKLVAMAKGIQEPEPEPGPTPEQEPLDALPVDQHAATILMQLERAAQVECEGASGYQSVPQLVDIDFVVDRFLAFAFPDVYDHNSENSRSNLQDKYSGITVLHQGRARRHTTPVPDPTDDKHWISAMRVGTLRHHIACIYCKKIHAQRNDARRMHELETLMSYVNEHYVPATYGRDQLSVKVLAEMSLGIKESQRTDRRVSLFGKLSCLHEPARWTPDHILAGDLALAVLEAAVSLASDCQGTPPVETAMQSELASVTLQVAKRAVHSVRQRIESDQQEHSTDEKHHAHFVSFPSQHELNDELRLLADSCCTSLPNAPAAEEHKGVSLDSGRPTVLLDLLLDWLIMRVFPAVYGTRHDHHGFRAAYGADRCEDQFTDLLSKLEKGGKAREIVVHAKGAQPAWLPAGTSRKNRAVLAVLKEMTAHESELGQHYPTPMNVHQIRTEVLEIYLEKIAEDHTDDSHGHPRMPLLEFIADEHFRHKYGIARLAVKHLADLSWGCRAHRASDRRIHTFVALSSIVEPEQFSHDHVVASDATLALLGALLNHGQQYGSAHHEHSKRLEQLQAGQELHLPVREVVEQMTAALPSGYEMPTLSRLIHSVATAGAPREEQVIDLFVALDVFVTTAFPQLLSADDRSGADPTLKVQDEVTQILENADVESVPISIDIAPPPCGPSIKPMQLRSVRKHIAGVWFVLITRERDRVALCHPNADRHDAGSGFNLAAELDAYVLRMYGITPVSRRTLHEFTLGATEYASSSRRISIFCVLSDIHQLQSKSAAALRATAAAACVELLRRVVPHPLQRCFDKLQSSRPGESGNGVPVQLARSALSDVIAAAEAAGNEWAQGQSSAGSVMDAVIANLEMHADDTIPKCVSIDTLLWQFVPHAFPDLLPMNDA